MLGQIDGPAAANLLAAMAVFSPRLEVRRQATAALTRIDPRDVVESLIDLIHEPLRYEVRPSVGPGTPGELFVEGEQFNVQRFYKNQTVVPALWGGRLFRAPSSFDPYGAAGGRHPDPFMLMMHDPGAQNDLGMSYQLLKMRETEQGLQQRLATDIQVVEATNAGINGLNARALDVLSAITGQDLGADQDTWKRWWTDQLGYAYQPSQPQIKPTYTSLVTQPLPSPPHRHTSCFAAGTLVRTVDGPRTIESIRVGDRVLSQNTTTGLLGFQPVVAVYHNKPAETLRLAVGGEPIVATGIHRFWKAGTGWTMARELRAGDRLRVVGGVAEVQSAEADAVQPVFNFEVADNRDYFVGKQGMLVHDYSFVQPVLEPFDRQPDRAAPVPASN